MTRRQKYRWLAVSLIWLVVLSLTGWNIRRIGRIQATRQNVETMQMDLRFLRANQAAIEKIRVQKSRLTHHVTSDDLGFLVVENNLKRLSWTVGLETLSVKTDADAPVSNLMSIFTEAHGTIPAVADWIAAVEEAYPYLVIRKLDLAYEPSTRTGRLQATFDYHFTLSAEEPVS